MFFSLKMAHWQKVSMMLLCILSNVKTQDLSKEEKKHFQDAHNSFRANANPSAADMNFLKWDDSLAELAAYWAATCPSNHGMLESKYGIVGQNIFWGSGGVFESAVAAWHNEYDQFDHNTGQCKDTCGHYTAIMWAEATKIGCGAANCQTGRILICNYYPTTNVAGELPYKLGRPCTMCDPDVGSVCYENLCVHSDDCNALDLACACNQFCLNCGTLYKSDCKCRCKDGWDGSDCSVPCNNSNVNCGKNSGSPNLSSCQKEPEVKKLCRKFCGLCNELDHNNIGDTCCEGKQCKTGQALNQTCECVEMDKAIEEALYDLPIVKEVQVPSSENSLHQTPNVFFTLVVNLLLFRISKIFSIR